MTLLFWICAIAGAGLLLLGVLADGVFESLLDSLPFGDDGEAMPVIGAFLGTFGIVGLVLDSLTASQLAVSLAGATIGGILMGIVALRLVRRLLRMHTDATPTSGDLVGRSGRVVTPIRSDAAGEVLVRLGGQPQKLLARADRDITVGTPVIVVEVLSASAVKVEPETSFFGGELEVPNP